MGAGDFFGFGSRRRNRSPAAAAKTTSDAST
jgi:hypothetical protein